MIPKLRISQAAVVKTMPYEGREKAESAVTWNRLCALILPLQLFSPSQIQHCIRMIPLPAVECVSTDRGAVRGGGVINYIVNIHLDPL